jgi:DNA-binding GntR family transcriptional regulator
MRIRRELSEQLNRLGASRPPFASAFDYHPYHGVGEVSRAQDGSASPALEYSDNHAKAANPPGPLSRRGRLSDGEVHAQGAQLHHAVLAVLRPAILVGDLPEGIRLIEEEIAAHLGVSRGPVREALGVLRDEGLVSIAPRRGAVVTGLHPNDIDDLYDLRLVLECHAIRRAAVDVGPADLTYLRQLDATMVAATGPFAPTDIAFHRHVLVLAKQERLLAAWERIAGIIAGLLAVTDTSRPDLVRHANLIAALEEHDGETAAAMLHLHIRNAQKIMRGVLAAR